MTTTTYETGGLVGAIARGASILKTKSLLDPLHWIVRAVLAAGMVLVYKKSASNPEWTDAAVAFLLGVAALTAEYLMGGRIIRAWKERSVVGIVACAAVYGVVAVYQGLMWTGTASEMEEHKAGMKRAAYDTQTTAKADKEAAFAALTRAEAKVTQLTAERWKPLPTVSGNTIGSAEEARNIWNKLKANTRFWDLTNGCTESAGKQTREYVKECNEAKQAIVASDTREALQPALTDAENTAKAAKAAYEAAKAKVGTGPVETSGERTDLRFLVKYAHMDEQTAQDFTAAWKILIISFLAFVLGMMTKAQELQHVPNKPWPFMEFPYRVWMGVKRALFGKVHTMGATTTIQVGGTVARRSLSGGTIIQHVSPSEAPA